MAVALFSESRPPGIYKQDYLNELYERYADDESIPKLIAPPYPQWDNNISNNDDQLTEDIDSDENDNSKAENKNTEFSSKLPRRGLKRPRTEETRLNAQFAEPNLAGIEVSRDSDEISRIRREMQSMCNWNGFVALLFYF